MRVELKYLVPTDHLDRLREALRPFLELDPHAAAFAGHGYTVRSVYLDTPTLRFYQEKEAGIKHRQKLRVRGYNTVSAESRVALEIKNKNGARVWKDRAWLPRWQLDEFVAAGRVDDAFPAEHAGEHDRDSAARFLYFVHRFGLRPTVLTVYEREAFFGRFDPGLRITFDRHLRGAICPSWSDLGRDDGLAYVRPDAFVLEVKYNHTFPGWLRPILADLEVRHQSFSKYCHCLDASRPRWNHDVDVLATTIPITR